MNGNRVLIVFFSAVLISFLSSIAVGQTGYNKGYGNKNNQQTEAFKKRQQEKSQAYLEQVNKDSEAFMKTLSGMNKQEKLKAVAAFKEDLYNKNCAFREEMCRERRVFVESMLSANQNITPAVKEKMLLRIDIEYEDLKAFHVQKHEENAEFLDRLAKDASVDGQKLDEALKNFFQSQKEDAKQFLKKQQDVYHKQEGINR